MSSVLSTLGLRAANAADSVPNHAPTWIIANWALAYIVLSSRAVKMITGLDHNTNPREDLSKYGEAAVSSGKISRRALERMKRNEAASANSMEGFTFFTAAMLLALHAGVPTETINGIGLWYTLSRAAYGAAYVFIESNGLSFLRSACWWSSNISCITALILAGKRL